MLLVSACFSIFWYLLMCFLARRTVRHTFDFINLLVAQNPRSIQESKIQNRHAKIKLVGDVKRRSGGAQYYLEARPRGIYITLWEANARYRLATSNTSKMSQYGGDYYNNGRGGGGGYNNSSYAGRSATSRTAAPAAKKRMLKLVILGDSG